MFSNTSCCNLWRSCSWMNISEKGVGDVRIPPSTKCSSLPLSSHGLQIIEGMFTHKSYPIRQPAKASLLAGSALSALVTAVWIDPRTLKHQGYVHHPLADKKHGSCRFIHVHMEIYTYILTYIHTSYICICIQYSICMYGDVCLFEADVNQNHPRTMPSASMHLWQPKFGAVVLTHGVI